MSRAEVLIVDDDPGVRELLAEALTRAGHQVRAAASGAEAIELVRKHELDVVITDIEMQGIDGIELCTRLVEARPDVPVIVLTAHENVETAVSAIRAGAYDFLAKPLALDLVALAVARAVAHHKLRGEVRRLRAGAVPQGLDGIVGESAGVKHVIELIRQVASSDASVLVTGESGTGKELVARGLHELSVRRAAPFVAINCAAISPLLLESELFGHVKGAFTDARRDRPGVFLQAAGGTIFLDEIGEMPLDMQVKLLRVLQERRVRPVGADTEIPFEARLVTATNRDLETEIEERRFRADLFYRINVVQIPVPPLRTRTSDILVLAQHFLRRHAERSRKAIDAISPAAAARLLAYDWPGNVRELENCMERAVALSQLSQIGLEVLPDRIREHKSTTLVIAADNVDEMITLAEMQRRYMRQVLEAAGGNKSHAARVLGIDRRSLYRQLNPAEAVDPPPDEG